MQIARFKSWYCLSFDPSEVVNSEFSYIWTLMSAYMYRCVPDMYLCTHTHEFNFSYFKTN